MATAVAIRATVATNIAQPALRKKTKRDFANDKSACEQNKNKAGNKTRIICESIENSNENSHGRGHTSDGSDQYCTGGLRKKQKIDFASGKSACEQKANKAGDSTRIIYESIKNSYENGHGRGHKSDGGDQYCTGGLRKNKK